MSRELVVRVATDVMKWKFYSYAGWYELGMFEINAALASAPVDWSPDTDIAAAMLVVEKMQKPNWAWHIESVYVNKKLMWFVTFWGDENGELITNDGAEEETLPLAICLAALKAVEAE